MREVPDCGFDSFGSKGPWDVFPRFTSPDPLKDPKHGPPPPQKKKDLVTRLGKLSDNWKVPFLNRLEDLGQITVQQW